MKPLPFVVLLAFACGLGESAGDRAVAAPTTTTAAATTTTRPASRPAGAAARGPGPVDVASNKPFVHEASGFIFPPTVGSFRRARVVRLDEAGQGVMIFFKDPDLKIALTVSVYGGGGVRLGPHFDAVKASLLPKGRLTNEQKWTLHQTEADVAGMRMTYEYIGMLDGVEQDLEGQACLVPLAGNYIRYDAIYPAADAKAARGRAGRFMEVLKLPEATKAAG